MKLTAVVIGATGLVGKQLVKLLIKDDRFKAIRILVRRDSGITHPKLEQNIVDFNDEKNWENKLKGDILFSALGTTLKQAGGKQKQYEIDFTLNYNLAIKAKEKGIENYVLVSSMSANSKSKLFYSRMKGELDDAVSEIWFKKLSILRPGPLTGDRENKRLMEELAIPVINFLTSFILKKYRPIKDEIVAKAMINAALYSHKQKTIWEGEEIFELADKN